MRQKTSVTLSEQALAAVDQIARGEASNRSRVIEQAVVELVERRARSLREARDSAILEAAADELNREMEDVLEYQVTP